MPLQCFERVRQCCGFKLESTLKAERHIAAGADFCGDDSDAIARISAALDNAALGAVALDVHPQCNVERDDLGDPRTTAQRSKPTQMQQAWDAADLPDAMAHWHPDWNWVELMKLRIRQSYRQRPSDLSWVFDKLELEALCNAVGGSDVTVPQIAAWYSGEELGLWESRVLPAVQQGTPLVVKPTHGSQAVAVAAFEAPRDVGLAVVRDAVDSALSAEPDRTEPWMLISLRRGVLVQQLYESEVPCMMTQPPFRCPLELKVQTLFGHVICGTVRAFPWQVTVLPDGSVHRWAATRVVEKRGLPKAWRVMWGTPVSPQSLAALREVLARDWHHIAALSVTIAAASRLDEVRIDWLLGDPRLGPRVGELQYIGAAGNIRPELQRFFCRAFLRGHRLRAEARGGGTVRPLE